MQVWVEFYTKRAIHLNRVAFNMKAYANYRGQHYKCPEGWQPKNAEICIHDYAYRVAKGIQKRSPIRSTIYCDTETTINTITKFLKEYIAEFYGARPETIKAEVDFT